MVAFDEITAALPADTTRITADERASILERRRASRARKVRAVTFSADELGRRRPRRDGSTRLRVAVLPEGLERTVDALNNEAELSEMGRIIQHATISNALIQRLKVEATYSQHPEIDDEVVGGPVFVIGLPRTGTTALSQAGGRRPAVSFVADVGIAGSDPAAGGRNPRHRSTYRPGRRRPADAERHVSADEDACTTPRRPLPTECQDLMGMSFRTFHFDGAVRVPSYLAWLMQCDMRETYTFHRRVLKLLQWHCPPTLWHLKTPVHMFALDALRRGVPEREIHVEPPRSRQSHGLGMQPHSIRTQLEQRPR